MTDNHHSIILLILSKLLNIYSHKVDYIQAFPQASLHDEDIYMELPSQDTLQNQHKIKMLYWEINKD